MSGPTNAPSNFTAADNKDTGEEMAVQLFADIRKWTQFYLSGGTQLKSELHSQRENI